MDLKNFIKSLSILHLLLLGVLVIITIWVIYKVNSFNSNTAIEGMLLYVVPLFAMVGYFGSQWIFKKMISSIQIATKLEDKLRKYKSALQLKYTFIEIPAFIGLFAYNTSGNALPLVISICLIAYLAVQRPNKEHIIKSIPVTEDEQEKIQLA
ncbi:hypothetical protein PXD56_09625 [Maribacter sp. SA7]|uniref:hypothetical protein n=1 Tax=Maribacter zhoushanensis TaxID=3030012 RepID=UPI0023EE09B6|nr:hypothetical protein [Maribacter zhoushanensis]MDF4203215.1 hypothetical protein [Maribacter zhoushanensis]